VLTTADETLGIWCSAAIEAAPKHSNAQIVMRLRLARYGVANRLTALSPSLVRLADMDRRQPEMHRR